MRGVWEMWPIRKDNAAELAKDRHAISAGAPGHGAGECAS